MSQTQKKGGGKRWIQLEEDALIEIRKQLKTKLENRPQFPEVVGDRRLLRFLRGKQHRVEIAIEMISNFLDWRDKNHIDEIRQQIVYGGLDSPWKFPKGEVILKLLPQIVITPYARDKHNRPTSMETFGFNPKEVFKQITAEEYLTFLMYTLEYRALVMEQISYEMEEEYLQNHPNPDEDGYGVVCLYFCILDLKGVGLSHFTTEVREMVGNAITVGTKNYQEYLGKNQVINIPWIFNTIWYFVKGFLDEDTLAKINLCGSDYKEHLLKDITMENIPKAFGGEFELYNEPYKFNLTEGGPLWYPGCEKDSLPYINEKKGNSGKEYCYYWDGKTPSNSPFITPSVSTRSNAGSTVTEEEEKGNDDPVMSLKGPKTSLLVAPSSVTSTKTTTTTSYRTNLSSEMRSTGRAPASESERQVKEKDDSLPPPPPTITPNIKKAINSSQVRALGEGEEVASKGVFYSLKQFLLYCTIEFPFLSCSSLILFVFALFFHPNLAISTLPSAFLTLILCLI